MCATCEFLILAVRVFNLGITPSPLSTGNSWHLLLLSLIEDVRSCLLFILFWELRSILSLSVHVRLLFSFPELLLRRVRIILREAFSDLWVLFCPFVILAFLFLVLLLFLTGLCTGTLFSVLKGLLFTRFFLFLGFLFVLFDFYWNSCLFFKTLLQIMFWINCYSFIIKVLRQLFSLTAFQLNSR